MHPSRVIGLLLPAALLHRAAANDCAAAREGLIAWWNETVSYTHLTLPTILLV